MKTLPVLPGQAASSRPSPVEIWQIVPLTTETALLSCIKQAREDVLTLRHLQLLHQNR